MSNLTKEAIEEIEQSWYIDQQKNTKPVNPYAYMYGAKTALTNPTIYQAAGLMSVDEALGFAEWYKSLSRLAYIHATTTDLLRIFRNQKKVK